MKIFEEVKVKVKNAKEIIRRLQNKFLSFQNLDKKFQSTEKKGLKNCIKKYQKNYPKFFQKVSQY